MGRGIAAAPEGWDQIGHAARRTDGAPEQEPQATRQLCQSPSSLGWRGSPTVGGFFLLGLINNAVGKLVPTLDSLRLTVTVM